VSWTGVGPLIQLDLVWWPQKFAKSLISPSRAMVTLLLYQSGMRRIEVLGMLRGAWLSREFVSLLAILRTVRGQCDSDVGAIRAMRCPI